jgi:RNA polymerase II transcription mediator complex subunit 9
MSSTSTPQPPANNSSFHITSSTPAPPPAGPPSLPSPSTFDILPALHTLLTRLLTSTAQPSDPNHPLSTDPEAAKPLEIQHLATEASKLKIRLQKARMAVLGLPDVDRTCEEQQEEIDELEERVARLKGILKGLGGEGVEGENMEGVVGDGKAGGIEDGGKDVRMEG